jgi:cold shock CspA family protein
LIGKIKRFNNSEGAGIIETENGTRVHVQKSAINAVTLEEYSLNQGDKVEFDLSSKLQGQESFTLENYSLSNSEGQEPDLNKQKVLYALNVRKLQ